MKNNNRGIILTIVIIVIALVLLSYFGFDFRKLAENPLVKQNAIYVWNLIKQAIAAVRQKLNL